jgi:hypothetical protein
MKSQQGLILTFATMFAISFLINCICVWHMAGFSKRLNEIKNGPTQKEFYGKRSK